MLCVCSCTLLPCNRIVVQRHYKCSCTLIGKITLHQVHQWASLAAHSRRESTVLVPSSAPSLQLAVSSPNALESRTETCG